MSKDCELSIRMSVELKDRITAEAEKRGESAAVIVREALRQYFASRQQSVSEVAALNEPGTRYHTNRTRKPKP